jgi:hypothetical protein
MTHNSYSQSDLKWKLYDSVQERNELFGYNHQHLMRVQENHNNSYLVNQFPLSQPYDTDYYFDLRAKDKSIIGFTEQTPHLYNDNVLPGQPTIEQPNLYKNWEPFTTTAAPVLKGQYTQFIPHTPVEIAPRQNSNYWSADLNARLYERQLISSAKEQPYANFYARQGMLNLLAQNMPSSTDRYLRKIEEPSSTLACAYSD